MFTAVLVVLGSGTIWVFAQMYRNPPLSRITYTSANELGKEFYVRLLSFGAVPFLTWLASQFPVTRVELSSVQTSTAEAQDALELHSSPHESEDENIRLAEEFLALRYVSVVRSVLVNLRYAMIFVSVAFVVAIHRQ